MSCLWVVEATSEPGSTETYPLIWIHDKGPGTYVLKIQCFHNTTTIDYSFFID